ncbi:hypothetical protein [Jongsikchunia kroppenstedtii]|uniref:hypothetical protein n=1 Tax=Jongsikchunia kroppenstedtii TaxID=1121721 RepID=UPI000477862E|nr:hypothetical protein [Jongsikchunia kroppenstedtii]
MDLNNLTAAVTRRELYAAGYTSNDLQRAERARIICRLAPGIFAPPTMRDAPPEIRHRARAVATARERVGALSFVSAAAVHGLPVWGIPLSRVHLSKAKSSAGSLSTGIVMTHCDRRPPAVTEIDGTEVVTVARTVVDLARTEPRIPAIVTGDAALHLGMCTLDDLHTELHTAAGFPGYHAARRAITQMTGLSESVLETRSRMLFVDTPDIPEPTLQLTVTDADGTFLARGDFGWEDERVIGECDGVGKYGDDPRRALLREKARTDRLHEAGWRVVRWGWHDLDFPDRVLDRTRRMLRPRAA